MNVRVASLVAERLTLRIIGFKKLENFKKVSEMLGFGGAQPTGRPRVKY